MSSATQLTANKTNATVNDGQTTIAAIPPKHSAMSPITDCVLSHDEVLGIDLFQTRIFGNKIYVDLEIQLDGSYTLQEAHDIAEAVHDDIEKQFPKVKHIMVHVNPK